MIIECISCNKKFSLNDALMPIEGSKVRCGGCSEVWFYHPTKDDALQTDDTNDSETNLNNTQEDLDPSITENTELENINDELAETPELDPEEENTELESEKTTDFKIFTDDLSEPSKAEMDKNLDNYIMERDGNLGFFAKLFRKDRLKESAKALEKKRISENENDTSRRTRLLFYLLIVLSIASSVMLVPIKREVISFFPFLEVYISIFEPMYYQTVQHWLKF